MKLIMMNFEIIFSIASLSMILGYFCKVNMNCKKIQLLNLTAVDSRQIYG